MLSTLLNYRYYATDINKTIDRFKSTATVEADTKYYQEKIGTVDNVDEFLDDYRLYTYALKAYGLEDQAGSKGFIRKVLESDLSSSKSFANLLADNRYRQFAGAFNFKSASAAASNTAQNSRQQEAVTEAYSEHRVRQGTAASAKAAYFETTLPTVTSVDELVDNTALFEFMMKTIGVDPALTSKTYVKNVFLGLEADDAASSGDDKFFQLADRFSFDASGAVAAGGTAIDAAGISRFIYDYNVKTDNNSTGQAAARNSAYWEATIPTITSAADLVADDRLVDYVRATFGLDPTTFSDFIEDVLTGDPADPTSRVGKLPTATETQLVYKDKLVALHDAFNFKTDGSLVTGKAAQDGAILSKTVDDYYDNYQKLSNKTDAEKASTYAFLITDISSVADLLVKHPTFGLDALNFVLKAFDIDPATASITKIRRVLQSDTSDPKSYVNKLGDDRYERLAAAFNFGPDGKVRGERLIQSTSAQTTMGSRYLQSFGTDLTDAKKDVIKADTRKYFSEISDIRTFEDFLASDTVTSYALKAYGLDEEEISTDQLRKIFTSDLGDPKSYAYSLNDSRYVDLVSSFNFDSKGLIQLEKNGVQTEAAQLSTENLHLLAAIEADAGNSNEGTRLALYFRRKAQGVTTIGLLADKALLEVTRTALGFPAAFTQLDIDKQVSLIESKLKVADFQDPKKLDRFIARFAALYDVANATTDPMLAIFSGNTSAETSGLLAML